MVWHCESAKRELKKLEIYGTQVSLIKDVLQGVLIVILTLPHLFDWNTLTSGQDLIIDIGICKFTPG
jgi:hypothetical protein